METEYARSCNGESQSWSSLHKDTSINSPNKLSELLIKILISIFQKLHQSSAPADCEEDAIAKLNISCMSSRSFISRSSFNSKSPMYTTNNTQAQDPYGVLLDGEERDIGPYKNFIHFTRSSLDISRIILCLPAIQRLRYFN